MHKKNILYVVVEAVDIEKNIQHKGLLGGFKKQKNDKKEVSFLKLYTNKKDTLYCASHFYTISYVSIYYEYDHKETTFFMNDKKDQQEAASYLKEVIKKLEHQGIISGMTGPRIEDYPAAPEWFNNTNVPKKNKNTTNKTTFQNRWEKSTFQAKKPSVTIIYRKSKKVTKSKLIKMRLATIKVTKNNYVNTVKLSSNKELENTVSDQNLIGYDQEWEDAWGHMHKPGYDYSD